VTAADPLAILRSRRYLGLLLVAAVLGVPVAAAAYWFLELVAGIQKFVYSDLPHWLGFHREPAWWPVPLLGLAGLAVGLTIRYLPGRGGESPADGFKPGGVARPAELPGIALAALASIGLGAVIGPEAPLIALGGGLAFLAVWLAKRDLPDKAGTVVAATGSFAAISTLLGSPLAGAFLLLEASQLGGLAASVVLIPGLLGAGTGALIFIGFDSLIGHGVYSLAVPHLAPVRRPSGVEFLWAVAIGVAAGPVCWGIRRLALMLRPYVERRLILLTPVAGLVIASLAIGYAKATGRSSSEVLFSGQDALPGLLTHGASYPLGAILLLVVCKALAYCTALSSFRGGPTFPAMFVGAAGGVAMSHLPGLPLIPAAAMGIAAMTTGILRLPMTATLLTTLFLGSDGVTVLPLVIVSAVACYVLTVRLAPPPPAGDQPSEAAEHRQVR
jgi:H+/Cl- antiporter ClcA